MTIPNVQFSGDVSPLPSGTLGVYLVRFVISMSTVEPDGS